MSREKSLISKQWRIDAEGRIGKLIGEACWVRERVLEAIDGDEVEGASLKRRVGKGIERCGGVTAITFGERSSRCPWKTKNADHLIRRRDKTSHFAEIAYSAPIYCRAVGKYLLRLPCDSSP